jgi:leukotriene-A4 hydrolase
MRIPAPALTRILLSLVTVVFLVNAKGRAVQHPSPLADPPIDDFTFSEPAKVTTRHLALDLTVDFEQRRLAGTATLGIKNLTGTSTLILDTYDLTVSRVTRDGVQASFRMGAETAWGEPLQIDIEPSTKEVTIEYATGSAPALFWNTAAQTYGRTRPYLYTQNEPIGARSWIPIQDTPTIRMTYEATLRVPAGYLAVMSCGNNPRQTSASGVYSFAMDQTIPAYLIALGVGRLEYHAFDERTGVYAEPELIEDAAWDLQYMPAMLAAAERILGPHPFPRHDVLLAPPTYIAGGMEHPMLNFISPFSVVSGNRAASPEPKNLMAHELAHSWAGDATTLATWYDVWLNEGITSYLTMRIIEEMGWTERVEYHWFVDRASYDGFAKTVPNPSVTTLHRKLADPGAGFSSTSYTKGALFLRTLEDHLGRTTLDAFLRDYFRSFAFRWVDDRNFLARLTASLGGPPSASIRINEWIYGTGLPSNVTAPTSSAMFARMKGHADRFNTGAAMSEFDAKAWTDVELEIFLGSLNPTISGSRIAEIDAALGLSMRATPPTNFLRLAVQNRYAPIDAAVERILMRGGPNSTMTLIYGWLIQVNKARAQQIFNAARPRYHASVVASVEKMLAQTNGTATRAA